MYFVSWWFTSSVMWVNLFVALILEVIFHVTGFILSLLGFKKAVIIDSVLGEGYIVPEQVLKLVMLCCL